MKVEREVMVWLAGLISTDGCVFKRGVRTPEKEGKHGWKYQVCSVEKDWKEQMQKILKGIKITSRIDENNIYLHGGKRITKLFIKHNCEKYFSPRKWKKVLEANDHYKNYALDRKGGKLYRCYKCGRYLERDQFHKNKTDIYGITSRCKECSRKAYLQNNSYRERHKSSRKKGELYWCPKCKQYLPKSSFYSDKNTKDHITTYCKECSKHYYKERRKERKEKPQKV